MTCKPLLLAVFALAAFGQLQNTPIGAIDFYGLDGLDAAHLRKALTVKQGDRFAWPGTRDRIREQAGRAAGRPVTHFAPVCCDENGGLLLYVGFVPPDATVAHRAKPSGAVTLPEALSALYREFMAQLPEALKAAPGLPEDYAEGYSLSRYAPARAIQMRMRTAALEHENDVLRALAEAGKDEDRAAAALLAGYTRQSPEQIAALVDAARDPHDPVRNNAIRSLAVLAHTPRFAALIPAHPFIDKLGSAVWSDRNKALMLLVPLSRNRDTALLSKIERSALPALREMAQWQFAGHASGPLTILGRIAGIPETELAALLSSGNRHAIFHALTISRP